MRLLDEQYTRTPFYGVLRMTAWLQRQGYAVNEKRVRRLLRTMGLMAIYPSPKTSRPAQSHRIYPYLLRGVAITRPNFVWSTDITYIRSGSWLCLSGGNHGLVQSLCAGLAAVEQPGDPLLCGSLRAGVGGHDPEIFNTDQGAQFTSLEFTSRLDQHGVRISMDGRGRALDNAFVERLWRSVKWEEVYVNSYQSVRDAWDGLNRYFAFYNHERPHQALAYRTPAEVHTQQP